MRLATLAFTALLTLTGQVQASDQLPVENIVIDTDKGPQSFTVEIAADSHSQERGLMFRREMDPDKGMIFRFDPPQFVSFWMKNTFLPLDMIFVRPDGTISSIHANAVPFSEDSIPSIEPVRAVIEINGGRAAALHIVPGDKVHAPDFAATSRHS